MPLIKCLNIDAAEDDDIHAAHDSGHTQAFTITLDDGRVFLVHDYADVCGGDIRQLSRVLREALPVWLCA